MTDPSSDPLNSEERARFAALADRLIPADGEMPAPSALGISEELLNRVLGARPDLSQPLRRALARFRPDAPDPIAWFDALATTDPEAWRAVALAVVGGYYLHPTVREILGYPGQSPEPVVPGFPEYMQDGSLERVYARGPRFRLAT